MQMQQRLLTRGENAAEAGRMVGAHPRSGRAWSQGTWRSLCEQWTAALSCARPQHRQTWTLTSHSRALTAASLHGIHHSSSKTHNPPSHVLCRG